MMTDRPARLGATHIAMSTVVLAALGLFLTVSAGATGLSSSAPDPIVSERPLDAVAISPAPVEAPTAPADTRETTKPSLSAVEPSLARDDDEDDEGRETVHPVVRDDGYDDEDDENEDGTESSAEGSSTDEPSEEKDRSDSED